MAIDWNQVIFKGLEMKGIYGREMFETWYKMVAMLQSGLDLTPIITHRFAAAHQRLHGSAHCRCNGWGHATIAGSSRTAAMVGLSRSVGLPNKALQRTLLVRIGAAERGR